MPRRWYLAAPVAPPSASPWSLDPRRVRALPAARLGAVAWVHGKLSDVENSRGLSRKIIGLITNGWCSIYASWKCRLFIYIWDIDEVNATTYSVHGAYGYVRNWWVPNNLWELCCVKNYRSEEKGWSWVTNWHMFARPSHWRTFRLSCWQKRWWKKYVDIPNQFYYLTWVYRIPYN